MHTLRKAKGDFLIEWRNGEEAHVVAIAFMADNAVRLVSRLNGGNCKVDYSVYDWPIDEPLDEALPPWD